jgi:hypothetical protein
MLACMPVGTNSTVTIQGKQLLLTIGRAGVLSSRAIAARELETLLRLLGPLAERQRTNLKRATDILLVEDGAVIGPARASSSPTPPMRWRVCKRRWHEHRYPQARAGPCSAARSQQ